MMRMPALTSPRQFWMKRGAGTPIANATYCHPDSSLVQVSTLTTCTCSDPDAVATLGTYVRGLMRSADTIDLGIVVLSGSSSMANSSAGTHRRRRSRDHVQHASLGSNGSKPLGGGAARPQCALTFKRPETDSRLRRVSWCSTTRLQTPSITSIGSGKWNRPLSHGPAISLSSSCS